MSTQTPVQSPPSSSTTPSPPPPRPTTGMALLGIVLIGAGTLWLLAALGVALPVALVTPVVLVSLGIAVTVSALRGEEHPALGLAVFVGVWLSLFALVTAVVEVPLTGAVGDVDIAPVSAGELDDAYRLFAGSQRLDLRDLELGPGTTELVVSTVLGEIEVRVPAGMAVRVDAAAAAGTVEVGGTPVEGVGLLREDVTEGWDAAEQRLDLELRVGLGEVRVHTD